MLRFAVRVFGCQMNVYDGDRLRTAFVHRGWEETDDASADFVVLVTCSIRDKAEQKVISEIGRYNLRYKADGQKPVVVLIGCMAQRIGRETAKRFPCVKLVSGPRHLGLVPQGIEDVFKDGESRFFLDDDPRALQDLEVAPLARTNPYKAYVTISYGCDRFCSYCIVPYVRGRLQSRRHEDILAECRTLAASGASEITLLGQNVDAYGKDTKDYTFAKLLKDVSEIDGITRLRFATSHPKDFDEDILQVMAETPSICRSINLPVQSGNDRILKEMNRGYTVEKYSGLVRKIRETLPDVMLTTDLIVGFPGETEEEYMDSYNMLRELRFDIVHTAAYSPREGTKAAVMDCQIDNRVKARRLNEINDMQSQLARELNEEYTGRTLQILADGFAPRGEGLIQGRTMSDKVVILQGSEADFGKTLSVKITRASHWSLEGERIQQ